VYDHHYVNIQALFNHHSGVWSSYQTINFTSHTSVCIWTNTNITLQVRLWIATLYSIDTLYFYHYTFISLQLWKNFNSWYT